ncbi:hypothetical protein LPJ53_006373, partial [Coemansia erecta]
MSSNATSSHSTATPTRAERKACHAKRDAYFACLDSNNIMLPEQRGTLCEDLRQAMYKGCPEVWANYFEQLREMQKKKELAYN